MERNYKKKSKKFNIKFLITIFILTFVLIYTFSKYMFQVDDKHIQTSENFYFNSNILTEDGNVYKLYDWDGQSTYSLNIELKNYEDTIRYTEKDIDYTISAISNNANITIENDSLTIPGKSANTDSITLKITPNEVITPNNFLEIDIEAKSSTPYEKIIKAKILLYVNSNLPYIANLENFSEYAIVGITTLNVDKELIIEYDSNKVYLDTTNLIFDGKVINTNGSVFKIETNLLENNKNYKLNFIKKNPNQDLTLGEDIVVK